MRREEDPHEAPDQAQSEAIDEAADEAPDETLMLCYRDGDARAFETLYLRHKGPLFRYLHRQVGNRATSEELFQDVWMSVIRARERYEVRAKFTTWLYRMAHNRVIDFRRATTRSPTSSNPGSNESNPIDSIPDPTAAPGRQAEAQRQLERLLVLVQDLPPEQREAFVLHEEAGMSVDDIARITDVGRETAKSRLRYAVSKLRAGLGERK